MRDSQNTKVYEIISAQLQAKNYQFILLKEELLTKVSDSKLMLY